MRVNEHTQLRNLFCLKKNLNESIPCIKVAVNTIVPRSPFFAFCTPKYRLLQTSNKMRSNVCVNEIALFEPFAAFVKGKTFFDNHGE